MCSIYYFCSPHRVRHLIKYSELKIILTFIDVWKSLDPGEMHYYFAFFVALLILGFLRNSNAHFLQSVSGEVFSGNFSYYTLIYPGFLSLELTSHRGDCDIYVSQYLPKPTFEHYSYCLQSSTCGLDTVLVPKSFKRPLVIGIYGHPSHEACSYTLDVYEASEVSDGVYEVVEVSRPAANAKSFHSESTENAKEEESYLMSVLWGLLMGMLEVLVDVLVL